MVFGWVSSMVSRLHVLGLFNMTQTTPTSLRISLSPNSGIKVMAFNYGTKLFQVSPRKPSDFTQSKVNKKLMPKKDSKNLAEQEFIILCQKASNIILKV